MKGYFTNIEKATKENTDYRRVLYTTKNSQLVLMCVMPGDEIGEEVHHDRDQFLRIEEGQGKAILDGVEHDVKEDDAIIVPAGTLHNFINTGTVALKLYTVYAPPEHKHDTLQKTKADEQAQEDDHFDGVTSE